MIPLVNGSQDFGVTDQERTTISRKYTSQGWLRLLEFENDGKKVELGRRYMHNAFAALQSSAGYLERAYKSLQGRDANNSMLMNPLLFQPTANKTLEPAVRNIVALVKGKTTLRSPITGETIDVDLPAFYREPPKSLAGLLPTAFDTKGKSEIEFSKGVTYRNYFHGRSIAWDNEAWQKLVPSAAGQGADYMEKAKRVIHSSRGAGKMFGMVDILVR
jgi:hypothetical protein